MADRLRCAVIGAGGIGLEHLINLASCPRAASVAIAENNPQRLKEAGERFRISRGYSDYRELLDQPDIDAVIVAVPNHLHAPVAIEALECRKHVLLEKPMATNAKDALKIVETARKMKRVVMVAQNFRFNRHTQMARTIIDRGDLGDVYHARGFWIRRSGIPRIGSWFTQKQLSGGGCTYDIGVHILDCCLHLIRDFEVVSVSAQIHSKFGTRGLGEMDWGRSEIDAKKPFDVEDFSVALLKTKSGKSVLLEVGWAAISPTDGREYGIDLLGTEAGISLFPARLLRNVADGFETVNLHVRQTPHTENRLHHFVNCILDSKKPIVPIDESVKTQQILDAIYASAATGKEVRVK